MVTKKYNSITTKGMVNSIAQTALEVLAIGYAIKHVALDRSVLDGFRTSTGALTQQNAEPIWDRLMSVVKSAVFGDLESLTSLVVDIVAISVYVSLLFQRVFGG